MNCAACGHDNPERAKFCLECGAAFAARCASCGLELPPAAKFCLECGTRVGAAPSAPVRAVEAPGARTVVSIIFADLVGSTALHERLDAEAVRQFMERYYAAMRGAVEAHGGRVTQVMGDGVKAVFGAPRVAEDDAIRAVRAGVAMQEAFRGLADEQRGRVGKTGLRVAVNTGEVVSDGESEIIGDPVNVAARLQEQGKDGDVVIGGSTQRIVGSLVTLDRLGSFALKGRNEQVEAYRVVSLEPPAATKAAFVGRDEELARLAAVYETAVTKPAAQLAVLLGSPGLGKSRLIDEFVRRLGDEATVFTAHCDASGGGTFAPLGAALRERLGVEDRAKPEVLRAALEAALPGEDADRARVVAGVMALAAGAPSSPEETFFAIRRLLATFAQAKPMVLVIDDLHWAESLLLDLVEHLVQWGSGVPLFVLVGARPELRELRSSLVVPGGLVSDVLTLAGLDAGAAMRLAAGVVGAADLPAALAAKLLASSEGNPLFVGELVKMLVQEGVLHREGERWVASAALADLEMPPTIHALLAARIERLRPEERAVLERAAVVGRHFSRSAVAALLASPAGLDAWLEALRRSELIERDTGWYLGEPVLRFHHVLIRDAAYRRILKGTRAELHARLAGWIEGKAGEATEHDEMIGWHLEQAHQHLAELGPLDANGVELGARAAQRLAAAGRRELARDDLALAASLLGRALACLPADAEERAELALDWCEALLSAGDVAPAAAALAELERVGAGSERLRAWHTCFTGQLSTLTSPQGLQATADSAAAAASALAALGDAAGEAKAHFVNAQALARLGKVGGCEAALDLALAAARRAGDRRRANAVLAGAPRAALWGPSPVTRASGRCLDVVRVLRITQGAPAVEAVALSCQGVLEALRGRTDAAKRMIASARELVEELGIAPRLFEADVFAGRVALLEGDAGGAERSLRGAYEGLRDLGLGIDAAQAAALLARALLAAGRAAEAEALSHESEALAGDDLQAAIAWRGARAEALAQRGEHEAAVALARAAVEIASATDALLDHADARVALAAALRAAGRSAEADAETRRARELWETKGATLLAERAARAGSRGEPAAAVRAVAPPPARRRRVRPNAATENSARLDAVVAARDGDALPGLFADDLRVLEHSTGASFDLAGGIASYRGLITALDPACHHEPLATLGESLALFRLHLSASGSRGRSMDVGPYEKDEVHVVETDAQGRRRAGETWSLNHLGDAVARLYERHAELLPEGPDRTRAEAVARSIAAMASQPDAARRAAVFAPDIEVVDHRTLGTWSAHGAESALRHFESISEISDAPLLRDHDVLALAPGALLTLRAHTGVGKQSGGEYERRFLNLLVAGADGRLARIEWFDAEREAEALARFDALTAAAAPPGPASRQVRPNAATALAARFAAAFSERDPVALAALWSDSLEVVDHPTGASYGREGHLDSVNRLARAKMPAMHIAPLATLGEDLLLARRSASASGTLGGRFDVGAWERTEPVLFERDATGRFARVEIFASERLGDAMVRLYERYAERLPEGPERARAARAAQSQAALVTGDFARLEVVHAPGFEAIDHRRLALWSGNAANHVEQLRSWQQVADDVRYVTREILALEPGALLAHVVNTGTGRAGGGAYERPFLSLSITDEVGRLARLELFDAGREADALARFDALAGAAPPPVRRRVRPNAATDDAARLDAAIAARDPAAFPALVADSLRVVDHTTGAEFDGEAAVAAWRALIGAREPTSQHEPLATLGASLALVRARFSASGVRSRRWDVGAYDKDEIHLVEVDGRGRRCGGEVWSPDHLGDGIARLYQRYAELLPEGPARDRAVTTSRVVAAMLTASVGQGFEASIAPGFEAVDHRLVGHESVPADALRRGFDARDELEDERSFRIDDVLALSRDGLLRRTTHSGIVRASGGPFERTVLALNLFGADGRISRHETFDAGQEEAALARFAALTGDAREAPASARRRVPDTAATRAAARVTAASAANDPAALAALYAEQFEVLHHPSGVSYGLFEVLKLHRSLSRGVTATFTGEPLAALGESIALVRRGISHQGIETRVGSIGPVESDTVAVVELDERGLVSRSEVFDSERLGSALVCLYERYAERLAEGPERERAAGMARSVAAFDGPVVLERWAAAYAPDVEQVDHRTLGSWSARGAAEALAHLRALQELTADADLRVDDVLAATPSAVLDRRTHVGTSVQSGGRYERAFLALQVGGADGRTVRLEFFDTGCEAEALARFEALRAGDAALHGFENAAARADERLMAAFNARDWPGVLACIAPGLIFDERRRITRNVAEREVWLEQFRLMFDQPKSRFTIRLVATRGERLSLHRHEFAAEVAGGGGPLEMEPHYALHEIDAEGRIVAILLFDLDDEAAAYAELDARFEAGEGAAYPRVLALSGALRRALVTRDWAAFATRMSPDFVQRDHRKLVWASQGRDLAGFLAMVRSLTDLAPDTTFHSDHARVCERGGLMQLRQRGSRDGGVFESEIVAVVEVDAEGRVSRWDTYDADPPDAALARYEEIRSPARAAAPFANAATRASDQMVALWSARDWAGLARLLPARFRFHDRRRIALLEIDRDAYVASMRTLGEMASTHIESELIATRGERLALMRRRIELAGGDVGPSELQNLTVTETDERGEPVALLRFDDDSLEVAYAELDARFAAGESAAHPPSSRWVAEFRRAFASRDWDAIDALQAPDQVAENHRLVGWGTLRGAGAWTRTLQELVALSPDVQQRVDHLRVSERVSLWQFAWHGTRDGGPFEAPILLVAELDEGGRQRRLDVWEPDMLEAARARFAELAAGAAGAPATLGPFANSATRAVERGAARVAARDWAGFSALMAPGFRYFDRTAIGKLETGRDEWLAAFREQIEMTAGPLVPQVLATRGERLALVRIAWRGAGGDVGESEIDWLLIIEANERAEHVAVVSFEPSDLAGAYRELDTRFASCSIFAAVERTYAAAYRRDREAWLAEFAPGWHADDHRRLGWGRTLDSAEMNFRAQQALLELAPDLRYRVDHFAVRGRAFLTQVAQVGTREGGPFESPFLYTGAVDERGLLARFEAYDVEAIDAARARFEALVAEAPAESPFANAATRAADRVIELWTAQNWELFGRSLPEGFRLSDRRRAVQLELDRDATRGFSRSLVEGGRSGRIRTETLATRGERLALLRWRVEVAGGDVGESEIRHLNLFEVDEQGALRNLVRWDDDAFEAALAELDARFAAGEGAASGAFAAVERVYAAIYRRDRETLLAQLAPGFRIDDHRRLGWGRTLDSEEMFFRANDTLIELAPDFRYRVDHFVVRGRAFLTQVAQVGTREGGPFESPFLYAGAVDESGLLTGFDVYDVEALDAARARFDALAVEAPAEPPFANAATRAEGHIIAAWHAHDYLEGFARQLSESFHNSDRRRAVQLELDREGTLAFTRSLLEGRSGRIHWENLATRGEHLALSRWRVEITGGDVGESEIPYVGLCEVDERGALRNLVRWDDDALEAAYAELEARFAASDRSAGAVWLGAFRSALERRDWDAMAALYAPDFVGSDHRLVGWGTLQGPVAIVEAVRQMVALAPDVRLRVDHVRTHPRGVISEVCWAGTHEGGAFESAFVSAAELAPDGRALRHDLYDPQQREQALARFEEIRAGERGDPLALFTKPNAASAWLDRFQLAFNTRDWDALPVLYATGVTYEDRQRLSLLSGGIELLLSSVRERAEAGARLERCQLLGSAGDRVAIQRLLWAGGGAEDRFEMEHIVVQEVDEAGRLVATINFDLDETRAAQREAWARWFAIEPALAATVVPFGEILDASNESDLARYRGALADDLVVENLDAALARFEALRPDPLRIPPNTSTRANDRWWAAAEAADWDAVRALTEGMVFEDRRRLIRIAGGAELVLADTQYLWEDGWRPARTLLATAGERLSLERMLWTRTEDGQRSEIEVLKVAEVDAEGHIAAYLIFDPDDRAAASEELFERWARLGADGVSPTWIEFLRTWNQHDCARMHALLPSDYVFHDRRRTGIGRIDGAEAYIDSLAALWELSADVRLEMLYEVAQAQNALLGIFRWFGTNAEGGEFEAVFVGLTLYRGGRPVGVDLFEVDDLDAALARFEELRDA